MKRFEVEFDWDEADVAHIACHGITPDDAEKVVDQDSAVVLDTKSPVLNWPNKISPEDFKGWIEERGHDFMKSWDSVYSG